MQRLLEYKVVVYNNNNRFYPVINTRHICVQNFKIEITTKQNILLRLLTTSPLFHQANNCQAKNGLQSAMIQDLYL